MRHGIRSTWSLVILFAVLAAAAATRTEAQTQGQTPPPAIFFTDLTNGPNSGGETVGAFAGAYVTIYGNFFGTSQGSSTVTLNGSNCGRVVSWGASYFWYQKIVFQLGSSCSGGNFVVTTSSGTSNTVPFAVGSGKIHCVSTSGNDSNAGTFPSSCWSTPAKAILAMTAGDVTYVGNGVSQTGATQFGAVVSLQGNPGGTAAAPIALVAYPGATATIGTAGVQYALRIPQIGVNPAYYTIAGMTLRGDVALEIAFADHMRFVGNDMSCDAKTGFGCAHIDQSTNIFMYGNNLHDVGSQCSSNSGNPTGSPCKFHGYYYTTNTNHVDHGWNIANMNPSGGPNGGCYGLQFYSTGGSDQFDLHVHDSVFENVVCGAVNFSTVNPDAGTVEAYNNVLFHNGTGPDPSGTSAAYYGIGTASISTHTNPVLIYNNSFYDNGSRGNVTNSNSCINVNSKAKVVNNTCQTSGSEQYISTNSSAINCSAFTGTNNNWYGNGSAQCSSQLTGGMSANPDYTSLTAGAQNLIPTSSSPLIGAGSTTLKPVRDIKGLVRPGPPSIGAYELSSGPIAQLPNPPTNLQLTVQ
jgi:hypothetical protein